MSSSIKSLSFSMTSFARVSFSPFSSFGKLKASRISANLSVKMHHLAITPFLLIFPNNLKKKDCFNISHNLDLCSKQSMYAIMAIFYYKSKICQIQLKTMASSLILKKNLSYMTKYKKDTSILRNFIDLSTSLALETLFLK